MKKTLLLIMTLAVTFVAMSQNTRFSKISVASWNIGHFSLGQSGDTRLSHDELKFYKQTYCSFFNEIGADLLALVEYNPLMVNAKDDKEAVDAREAILSNYEVAQVGPKYSYNCNAIFSNGLVVLRTDTVFFSKMVQKRYYLVSTMLLDGDTVKVVSTHLDWNQGENGAPYRALQIEELISAFESDRYVILCGDWNTGKSTEYDAFEQAGYHMANHGYLGDLNTFPAGAAPRSSLDNIIVKGFALSHVEVVNNAMLSDHCLIKADLVKLP